MGGRLRRLREEQQLTQVAVARSLGLSASYYNQLEHDERPLTVPVLLKLSRVFGVDVQVFSEEDTARAMSELREALASGAPDESVSSTELRELAERLPGVSRALLTLHRRFREVSDRADALADRMGTREAWAPSLMPFEEVRDFFYVRHNYIHELDSAAERLVVEAALPVGEMGPGLAALLRERHGVQVIIEPESDARSPQRRYDPQRRELRLAGTLGVGQRAFQLATQIALLELPELIQQLVNGASFSSDEARRLARIGLANHFAGALVMPYGPFLASAEELRYDIERLGARFQVGFEGVCHRLSTLQRPDALGVPFFLIRVDRAGNISKRQSATSFHFSRVGGTCPLWNVYEAFASPGKVLRQLAQMPDGRTYLWIARTVERGYVGYAAPSKVFAIALGCDVHHARRLVYSQGLNLDDPSAPTPIGAGCKVCERRACPQRALPSIGGRLEVDENERRLEPYRVAGGLE